MEVSLFSPHWFSQKDYQSILSAVMDFVRSLIAFPLRQQG